MNHQIILESELEDEFPYQALLEKVITTALDMQGVEADCEIDVLITDDAGIHEINMDQRGIDRATDVLSFPMFEFTAGEPPIDDSDADPASGLTPLGDMVISMERALEQAQEYGHTIERELSYLAVHSVLHLLGYDHVDEGEQKAQMRTREEAILGALGITREGE